MGALKLNRQIVGQLQALPYLRTLAFEYRLLDLKLVKLKPLILLPQIDIL